MTLEYISKFADMLEGMRRYEIDRHGKLYPHMAAAPLNEIRTNLDLVRAYVDKKEAQTAPAPSGFGQVLSKSERERQEDLPQA